MNIKYLTIIYAACIAFLISGSAIGQKTITVAGEIGHQETNTMLAGVALTLTGGTTRTTQTDSAGR